MTRIWSIFGIIYFGRLAAGKGHGSCSHDGMEFNNGENFTPHYPELLSTELPGQCMQCNCNFGVVYCELIMCAFLDCNKQDRSKPCCRHCPSEDTVKSASDSSISLEPDKTSDLIFPVPKPSKTRKKNDCLSDGKFYKDGSSWQPIIGPLGTMSCVQCGCVSGDVRCKRFPCRELPCSHPRKQFGHCCPVCPSLETSVNGGVNCLPRSSEVFVFKRPKMGRTAQIIEYGFIQSSSRNKLDIHTWDTNQTNENKLETIIMPKTSLNDRNLTIAGSTSFKHWTRFVKREKLLKTRCKGNCADRVVRLEGTLKLYPVSSRARCRSDEIDAAGL